MKYKSDKYILECDPIVEAYTMRRIQELRGERPEMLHGPVHPYIRRRLDEIKKEHEEK